MKRLSALVFIAMLALFCAAAAASWTSDEKISEQERRALAERPGFAVESYLSGAYYRAWDEYLADHVPWRIELVHLADRLRELHGLEQEAGIVEVGADIGVDSAGDGGGEAGGQEKRQSLITLSDRLLEVYDDDPATRGYYAETVGRIAEAAPEGVKVYSMLVPMPIEFAEERYRRESDPQKEAISEVYAAYGGRIRTVDAYAQLERHSSEYVYFRTDHHWTALGAYFGMRAFAEAAGFEPLGIEAYKETPLEGFLGQLYRLAPAGDIGERPDTLSYYLLKGRNNPTTVHYYGEDGVFYSFSGKAIDLSFAGKEPSIGIFIGGDYPLIDIFGDGPKGRVLAVVKDSYGNAFVPWLAPYFENILCVDPRSYREDFGAMLRQNGVTDLLVLDYLKVLMLPAYVDSMNEMLAAGEGTE
ncbi:MAG: hypothetical protein LBS32_07825 [Clostridiales Family XIII bacterium]|jgi:hypothetical protein|nr:hypothetical protein [Clostridiales Family XIII bacterium]